MVPLIRGSPDNKHTHTCRLKTCVHTHLRTAAVLSLPTPRGGTQEGVRGDGHSADLPELVSARHILPLAFLCPHSEAGGPPSDSTEGKNFLPSSGAD